VSGRQGSQKRRKQDLNDGDGLDDGDNGSSRPMKKPKNLVPPRKCFACPFCKKNPREHRDCFDYKLSRIKDVKQHLARQHTPIHCERCLRVFQDRHSKTEHFESDEPCVRGLHGELDGVTNEQSEDLRKKSKRGQTEPEQWYTIWCILFSSLKQPDSPYMDFEQSQEFVEWEEFCQRRGSAVLAERLSRQLWGGSGSPAWLPELLRMVQDGFRAAFDEFRSQDGSSMLSAEAKGADGTWLGEVDALSGQSGRQGSQRPAETPIPQPLHAPNHIMGVAGGIEEHEGCNETTLSRGRTRHNGGTSATRPQSGCEYHLFRRETSPEEEEEDNLGLSFPLGILRRSSVFGFACPCDWTSDEGRGVGPTTAEGEGRCRIGFRLPLAMGNKGGALVHHAGATELVFRDNVNIGASCRRNVGWTFSGFGLARCGSLMR